jgi:hypothetical protein
MVEKVWSNERPLFLARPRVHTSHGTAADAQEDQWIMKKHQE